MKSRPSFAPAVHGSLSSAERAAIGEAFVDFGVNTSPYGPCQILIDAVRGAPLDLYPDQYAEGARVAWGDALARPVDSIAFGAGGAELIWAACRAFLGPDRGLMVLGPTFSEPAECARAMGVPHFTLNAGIPGSGSEPGAAPWTVDSIRRGIHHCPFEVGLIYLCSPNNPTGTVMSLELVQEIAAVIAPTRILYDRSFETVRMVPISASSPVPTIKDLFDVASSSGLLELRSFTKDFTVPGLRLGALFGVEKDIDSCRAQMPPWSVSSMASAAALAILEPASLHFLASSRVHWSNDAAELWASLLTRGFDPVPSAVPFALVPVGNGATFRQELLTQGIHVRDCASFGLPEYVRICARGSDEQARLMKAIDSLALSPS